MGPSEPKQSKDALTYKHRGGQCRCEHPDKETKAEGSRRAQDPRDQRATAGLRAQESPPKVAPTVHHVPDSPSVLKPSMP